MASKVTVYVPCLNAEETVGPCLASLISQRRKPDEIIVVDDGSTDRSVDVARRYGVRCARHETGMGLATTRNSGIQMATGDLVASLDADCCADPLWLDTLVRHIDGAPNLVGAAGRLYEREHDTIADRWRATHLPQHWGRSPVTDPPYLHGANTVFRRQALIDAGLYPTALLTDGEDLAISIRLARGRPKAALLYDPAALVMRLRRDDPASVIRAYWRNRTHAWWQQKPRRTVAETAARTGALWRELLSVWLPEDMRRRRWGSALIDLAAAPCVAVMQACQYWRGRRGASAAAGTRPTP